MCGKQLTDVFADHAEYEPFPDAEEIDMGSEIFGFTNNNDEYIMYRRYDRDSFVATYTDRQGASHHYRVTPQISIRVSTLVVNRLGYTLIDDATDLGSMRETAES